MDAATLVPPPYVAGPLELAPFHALMLVPRRVGDPSTGRAFARPYKDVAARLNRWQSRGLVRRSDTEALYLHEYTANGMTVRGLVGALDVSRRATSPGERAVLPHEGIHPAQADDLADRMTEMQLNPAPILLVHHGTDELRRLTKAVMQSAPDRRFTDRSDQRHRIWAITERATIDAVAAEIAGSRALIADGHHRYAAYLRMQRRQPGGPCDRGLAMLVDHDSTPLFLGAIHRTLRDTNLEDLRDAAHSLGHGFRVARQQAAVAALGPDHLAVTDGTEWAIVDLQIPADRAAVQVLHEQLLPALRHGPSAIGYHHTAEEALERAQPGQVLAVLLPAPAVELVLRIAADDHLLPEKATSFQPKPSLGVLIRALHDGPPASR